MPKGDREILKADCEDGYTRIANLILEALSMVKLNATQTGICLFLLRRTYGWNRRQDAISLGDFAAAVGTSKTYVSRQLADLLHKKIIRRLTYTPGRTPIYAFSSSIAEWDATCINLQALTKNAQQGLYECAPAERGEQLSESGGGLSNQTTPNREGLSDQTSYGLSKRIRVGLSDCTTPNQDQSQAQPEIDPSLKTIIKTIKEKDIYPPGSIHFQLAELLLLKIMEHIPNYKPPDLQKWAKTVDALLRLDKRDPEEVKAIIVFAQGDPFWRDTILSVENLRKNYDRLSVQCYQPWAGPGRNPIYRATLREADIVDKYEGFFT
jgi:phage replication O-like protein O